jgi:methylphosphotriester-DNA--protein-cysteine methyltransferase
VADVRPWPSVPHAPDDLTQLDAVGLDHEVDRQAVGGPRLGRSAFMVRFARAVGRSPMTVLRELRVRQAAEQLASGALTVDEIVRHAGYANRSSFVRAFRKAYGCDPSSYREPNTRSATIEP